MGTDKNDGLRKQLEDSEKSNSELLARIDELSGKLYDVNKKLKEAEALKGHFISNITNEIINPFASILALSENILKLDDESMDKAKKMAGLINSEAFHLDFQLANIFAAAMIESGKELVNYSSVNLNELMTLVVVYFDKQIEAKQVQVELQLEDNSNGNAEAFVTDNKKVEVIFKNLLSNAVKFSYAGGKVEFKLVVSNTGLQLLVRDYGKGVSEEHRKEIYDRFKQVDERINSINSGHGLGLSIVKSYCMLLEGKLAMHFPADDGTEILVELPFADLTDQYDDLSDFIIDVGEKF